MNHLVDPVVEERLRVELESEAVSISLQLLTIHIALPALAQHVLNAVHVRVQLPLYLPSPYDRACHWRQVPGLRVKRGEKKEKKKKKEKEEKEEEGEKGKEEEEEKEYLAHARVGAVGVSRLELFMQRLNVVLDTLYQLCLVLPDGASDVGPHKEGVESGRWWW